MATTRTRSASGDRATASRPGTGARATRPTSAPLADTGVPSPYALAEVIARRHIDWDSVGNRQALLEDIFQTPYSDLFDPANGSPLYIGQTHKPDGTVVRGRPKFARKAKDLITSVDLQGVRNLSQLAERLGATRLADVPVRSAFAMTSGVRVELGETLEARDARWQTLFDPQLIDIIFPLKPGYHPDGYSWQDAGRFFSEAAEFFDPIQGFVGDCYFIAALSSVAWSMPYVIADQVRATGADNEQFTHQVGFHGSKGMEYVETTDRILVDGGGSTYFAHSRESGEIWPAVYEKAYAKWRLGETSDYPAIPNIAGGDASIACKALTGLSDYRYWHSSYTAADVLQVVKNHCVNGRTTTPMIAWTYNSGEAADVAYTDASVVACHAYSVLGWLRRTEFVDPFRLTDFIPHYVPIDWTVPVGPVPPRPPALSAGYWGTSATPVLGLESSMLRARATPVDYVVLRNPWGYAEGTGPSVAAGSHHAVDVDWWRSIPLGADGVFAMEINAFHRYFAGTGGAD